jgi:hypothetical protein
VTVQNIEDDHHVVRHCKFKHYYLKAGKIVPYVDAFHLRPATQTLPAEDYLSGVYYEWLDGTHPEKLRASCHFIGMEIKPKDALLRLNAGLIRKQGVEKNKRLRVLHEPDRECPPYATIRGLPFDPDNELCALLATLSVVEAIDRASVESL